MRELLAVEYVSKGESKKEGTDPLHFLDGCRGEVCKKTWMAIRKGNTGTTMISVRFPLALPGGVIKLYPNWGFADDDLEEQGVMVPIFNLRAVNKTPVSRFKAVDWEEGSDPTDQVFEQDSYLKFASLESLQECLEKVRPEMKYSWLWYTESHSDTKNVFMQARIYGIDKIIASYAPTKFKGIAIQVFTRPVKDTVERMRSDVYLLSNTDEYVSYVDGVDIKRSQLANPQGSYSMSHLMASRYPAGRFLTPRAFMNKDEMKRKTEEEKLLAAMERAKTSMRSGSISLSTSAWVYNTSSTTNY